MANAITVRGLSRSYRGHVALDGIDLSVRDGETLGILGRNGAGKTTLVETIAGLRRADAGEVRVLGLDPVRDRARVRSILGVQLQDALLHYSLTVAENMRLHRSFHRDGEDPDALIARLGLNEARRKRTQDLSGGQRQRLSIGVALVGRPRVVILDELTTGLDPDGRRGIWEVIEGLQADGVTILLVSHSLDEVERLCGRLVILDRGRIIVEGPSDAVRRRAGEDDLERAFLALTSEPAETEARS
ncbi:ABC transporter ATP-binding protein [Microbacterium karelineae]|uniref:ABC transporter ATP-binding protein n=1 Tax=Microbacterium karelineae TaxID=2654283 RepID=UPI0012E9C748|nr:ABC transporter ATP-binding protein [Microbacterium karelineae]